MTGGCSRPLAGCSLSSHCRALLASWVLPQGPQIKKTPMFIGTPRLLSFTTSIFDETCRSSNMLMTSSKTGSVDLKCLGRY